MEVEKTSTGIPPTENQPNQPKQTATDLSQKNIASQGDPALATTGQPAPPVPPASQTAEKPVREKSNIGSAKDQPPAEKKKQGLSLFGVSANEKVFLARHLSTILKAGISLPESLEIVQKQSKGKLKKVLSDVIVKVEAGKALNVALSDHTDVFDPLFINMVKVGEKSGTLDESLKYLSLQLSKDARLISKVKSASLYPMIVLITAVLVGGGISYFVLPKLAKLFTAFKTDLPLATRVLLKISGSIEHFGLWWLAGIIGVIVVFALLSGFYFFRAIWNWTTLRLPIAGRLVKSLNLARFSLTLGTLLKSSVAIDEALSITKGSISSIPYQKAVGRILDHVGKGKTMAQALDSVDPKQKLFPGTTRAMIRVGEKTGSLYSSLLYISEFYEEEVDNITRDLSTTLEPILLIIIAFVVAFVAIAIISPMYQILGSINR